MNNSLMMLVAFVTGFVCAQLIKTIIDLATGRLKKYKGNFGEMVAYATRSGGMPSGHTASFTGAVTFLGLWQGFDSPVFVLGVCMLMVIVYDAVNVRYSVGEHGRTLNTIIKAGKYDLKTLRVVEGHTVLEVVAGMIIGVLIGYLCFLVK